MPEILEDLSAPDLVVSRRQGVGAHEILSVLLVTRARL